MEGGYCTTRELFECVEGDLKSPLNNQKEPSFYQKKEYHVVNLEKKEKILKLMDNSKISETVPSQDLHLSPIRDTEG